MMRPELFKSIKGYTPKAFAADLSAGIIVGIVALPLAIAFAIASGVEPAQGLFTAIVAGFIISLLGGSKVQIGGPTGAFAVIVYGVIAQHGMTGLMTATMMAGIMLILLGAFKLGGLIKFIPYTIVVGFTAGIALTIFTSQIGDFFGLKPTNVPGDFIGKLIAYIKAAPTINPYAVGMAIISLCIVLLWPKIPVISNKIPGSLIVIILMTIICQVLHLPIETIGSRYGTIPTVLPAPQLPQISLPLIQELFPVAISIALLGAIESLLSAVVADGMIGAKHDSNMELIAQGAANIISPLFNGIPATGAIARTATNIKNGGRTPVAGIVHALTLLLIMMLFGKYAVYIPLCALAAILVSVSWNMAGFSTIKMLFRGQKSDMTVFLVSFLLTVFIDLTAAIEVGLICAAFFFIKKMVDLSSVTELHSSKNLNNAQKAAIQTARQFVSAAKDDSEETDRENQINTIPDHILVFEIQGPLFFGTIQKFEQALDLMSDQYQILILRMQDTIYLDAGGLHVLETLCETCRKRHIRLMIADIHTQPYMLVHKYGLHETIGKENICGSLNEALEAAQL